jgi:hypothetical protein
VPAHWFRISFARNAFLRSLGSPIESLNLARGVRAMVAFGRDYRPQHGELDVLECSWGPGGEGFEFAIARRMRRHGHPENELALVFEYSASPTRSTSGRASVTAVRDVTATEGYRAISRAVPRARRLVDQSASSAVLAQPDP